MASPSAEMSIRTPFSSTPTDTLDSHLLTQSLSLLTFNSDFLAAESDHREWCHLVGPLAAGTPVHLLPITQIIHHPHRQPSPSIYLMPYSSLPLQWSQRLSGSHTLTVATNYSSEVSSLPQAADQFVDTLRLVSAVESPFTAPQETRYWHWTGLGRYSGHMGATARLPAISLSSLSPSLSQIIPYISSSVTVTASQSRLALSHASFRGHIRPFAGVGDRGLLTAETLLTRGVDETWMGVRVAYTHRLSESRTEADPAIFSSAITEAESRTAADTIRDVRNRVQSAAAEVVSPSFTQTLNEYWRYATQPVSNLFSFAAPLLTRFPPPPPPPLLPWSFPTYLSVGLSHSAPAFSHADANGVAPQRPFRLTDHSSHWLSDLQLGVGVMARPRSWMTVQLEGHASEQRLAVDGRVWLRTRAEGRGGVKVAGTSNGLASGFFFGGSAVSFRRQPEQSHAALTLGVSYMY